MTNFQGIVTYSGDPEPGGSIWHPPEKMTPRNYLHHNAVFEMRSTPVSGGHGHQATYDADGYLIRTTIAAGTADKFSPTDLMAKMRHRQNDVHPYLDALQLDGNPVRPTNATGWMTETVPSRLNVPCLYQGRHTENYLFCRPTTPTGTTP